MSTDNTEKKPGLLARLLSPEFSFVKYGKHMAIISGIILLVGVLVVAIPSIGFNLGLDFTGGTIITIKSETISDESVYRDYETQIRQKLGDFDISGAEFQRQESVNSGYTMTVTYNNEDADVTEVQTALESITGAGSVIGVDDLDPKMGSEYLLTAVIAVATALICILIYIALRFKFTSGVAAIIGLFHDALVMLALVAITRIQVNSSFVAALITVVAYSINNTLVLFDRVRDVEKDKQVRQTTTQVVDRSLKETLGRTLNTMVTTLVPVFVLSILGIDLIRQFAVPIIFGLVAGTFSTIFLTSALYVRFETARLAKVRRKSLEK